MVLDEAYYIFTKALIVVILLWGVHEYFRLRQWLAIVSTLLDALYRKMDP